MLDPILNINSQEKYKSSSKVQTNQYYSINRHEDEKHHARDTFLFSSLGKLMSQINWRILNINYPSNDEILFHFLVEDLEFITVINFTDLYRNPFHEFSIYKKSNLNYAVNIKVEKEKIGILKTAEKIRIDYLLELFKRIIRKTHLKKYTIEQPQILEQFSFGIEENIMEELNYILKVIYTFISTRNGNKIKNNFVLKTPKNIPIIMQKVVIKRTD